MSSQDSVKQTCENPWWRLMGSFIPEDHLLERILSRPNMQRAWKRVKGNRGSAGVVSMSYRFKKLAEYIQGWVNYFGISEYYRPIPGIDHWLRRRIRMCYWKQWRYCRTKVSRLLSLGTNLKLGIYVGLSRKGSWRLSRTLATHSGMTNQWLKDQGLVSVKELWVKIHYPATAR